MKTEELTALGISEEVAAKVLAINGKDVEHAKSTVGDAKQKEIDKLTGERDGLQAKLDTATETLKKFEGIDLEQIQTELKDYKDRAEKAEQDYTRGITERDQKDWLKKKLDDYGVKSPLARKQIMREVMSPDEGLKWQPEKGDKPATFFGFDDYMKAAKEEDPSLYLTAEEQAELDKQKKLEEDGPEFTGPAGDEPGAGGKEKYTPPKIF